MKLGTEMDTQKTAKSAMSEEPTVKKDASNRHLKIAIVALVALIVVGAIVVSAVFIGGKIAKDAIKEAAEFKYVFHSEDEKTVEETIAVTDKEEDIGLKDGTHIVYDYSSGFMVMKIHENEKTTCYVSTFERSDTHAHTSEEYSSMDQQQNVTTSPRIDYYIDKSVSVNPDILSKRARDMCAGSNLYWMSKDVNHEVEGGDRRRRALGCSCSFYCWCCWGCGYRCRCYWSW